MKKFFALPHFQPKLLAFWGRYRRDDFWADLSAGITVGIVALPLAMGFAIASGLKPESGIFTAIVAGFLISVLGGSRVQIGGPAGAFIVVVYGIIEKYGVDGLLISTMLAGLILLALGFLRLGSFIRFVPVSIVIGFTNGIAVLIAFSQVKDFLGLSGPPMPAEFFSKLGAIAAQIPTTNFTALGIGCLSLLIVFGYPVLVKRLGIKALERVPGTIIALVVGTMLVSFLQLPVETIGTRFGGIPASLPQFVWPSFDVTRLVDLWSPAVTIALLGAIESLLCARVADGMIKDRHDPNQELLAQGLANIAAPMFGGFCATGTIARTVTNIRAGAHSPIAGIIHAITLLAIILVAAPLAVNVPLATLAAILFFVAYNMGEWHEFVRLRHFSKRYGTILLATFALTVVVDLTVAIEAGLFLACLFFIQRVSSLTRIEPVSEREAVGHATPGHRVEAYRIFGSLFFGAVDKLEELTDPARPVPQALVLDLSNLLNIDTTGVEALENVWETLAARGCRLILCGAAGQAQSLLHRSGLAEKIGAVNLYPTLGEALDAAARTAGEAIDPNRVLFD